MTHSNRVLSRKALKALGGAKFSLVVSKKRFGGRNLFTVVIRSRALGGEGYRWVGAAASRREAKAEALEALVRGEKKKTIKIRSSVLGDVVGVLASLGGGVAPGARLAGLRRWS
jgi:hypothetical protein